jgi:hypothetical protein
LAAEGHLLDEHLNTQILHCYWTVGEKAGRRYKLISNELKYHTYTTTAIIIIIIIIIIMVKKRN